MDPLSGAASVFAVVSLAFQLVDYIVQIRDFCKRVKGSKSQIDRLLADLSLLQTILESVASSQQNLDTTLNAAPLYLALEQCAEHIRPFKAFVHDLESNRKTRRKTTALKIALSTSRLAEFQAHLDSAKLTLNTCIGVTSLLFSYASREAILLQLSDLHRTIKSSADDRLAICEVPSNSPYEVSDPSDIIPPYSQNYELINCSNISIYRWRLQRWIPRSLWSPFLFAFLDHLGRIEYQSRKRKLIRPSSEQGDLETIMGDNQVILAIFPILRRAFSYRASAVYGNWSHSLRFHPILPKDAPVWKVCKTRNLLELTRLFSSREVSPFVLTPDGASLLHYAVKGGSIEIIKLLLGIGLDCNLQGKHKAFWGRTRLTKSLYVGYSQPLACMSFRDCDIDSPAVSEEAIKIMRTFFVRIDYDLDAKQLRALCRGVPEIKWLLSQDYQLLPQWFLDCILHEICAWIGSDDLPGDEWTGVVGQALKRGANIHAHINRYWYFPSDYPLLPSRKTPLDTFFVYRRDWDATPWLEVLEKFGIDLQEYAKEEQRLHPLNHLVFHCCGGETGLRRVKYYYPRTTEGKMKIRLGSLLDWESAFYDPKCFRNEISFGLKYLFEGTAEDKDYYDSGWSSKSELLDQYPQEPSAFQEAYSILRSQKLWLYWIIISLICHLYLHFWILPWFSRVFGRGILA